LCVGLGIQPPVSWVIAVLSRLNHITLMHDAKIQTGSFDKADYQLLQVFSYFIYIGFTVLLRQKSDIGIRTVIF
jgi:hypothetical protein